MRPSLPSAPERLPEPQTLAKHYHAFSLALVQQLVDPKRPANLIVSPYSIAELLAVAYTGASGKTAAVIARTLGFGTSPVAEVLAGEVR